MSRDLRDLEGRDIERWVRGAKAHNEGASDRTENDALRENAPDFCVEGWSPHDGTRAFIRLTDTIQGMEYRGVHDVGWFQRRGVMDCGGTFRRTGLVWAEAKALAKRFRDIGQNVSIYFSPTGERIAG